MLMNDEQTEELKQKTLSPLKNDETGRFSRKGKIIKSIKHYYPLLDTIGVLLFSLFLMGSDLVLFAGSGNIAVFKNSIFPIPEILLIMGAFLLVISFIVFFARNCITYKALVAAFFTFLFVIAIHNQFAQLNSSIDVGINSISSSVAIALVLAAAVFWIYAKKNIIWKLFLTLMPMVLFFNICSTLINKDVSEFLTVTENENTNTADKNQRLIYVVLPNYIGHNQIKSWNTKEAEEIYNLTEDFYKKNKFKVFGNAYVESYDYFDNLIMFLNPKATRNNIKKYILPTRLLSGSWQFSNLIHNNINLKNNELFDYLGYQGYNISTYKSRNIDLCRKNHQMNVQRCVEKVNLPTNIYDMNLSLSSRTNILLMEWLFSLKRCNNTLAFFKYISKSLLLNNLQQINIMYNDLYVVNSIKFFDILYDNIKSDKGKQAYFVFADIPSDMYIYDEFCRIKPKNEWLDRTSLSSDTDDYTTARKSAYMQQYRCLYGKIQQFIDNLSENNLLENTKIVLAGASNVNNFQSVLSDDYAQRFIDNNLVNLAIYDNNKAVFEKDNTICKSRIFVTKELFGIGRCEEIDNIHEQTLKNIKSKLFDINNQQPVENDENFNKWYEDWKKYNVQ